MDAGRKYKLPITVQFFFLQRNNRKDRLRLRTQLSECSQHGR